MKAILMSIRPQHLINILKGKTDIELRKKFPSDFRGWIYAYCTLGRPYLNYDHDFFCKIDEDDYEEYKIYELHDTRGDWTYLNGKVVCRFWVDNILNIFSVFKAILISKLEIFDEPKELNEFYYYKKRLIDCGMDCPPYFDEVKTQVRKAPQSWQYVEVEE